MRWEKVGNKVEIPTSKTGKHTGWFWRVQVIVDGYGRPTMRLSKCRTRNKLVTEGTTTDEMSAVNIARVVHAKGIADAIYMLLPEFEEERMKRAVQRFLNFRDDKERERLIQWMGEDKLTKLISNITEERENLYKEWVKRNEDERE